MMMHIAKINKAIQSNNDGNDQNNSLIKENPDNSLDTTANRKPTNRGRSLNKKSINEESLSKSGTMMFNIKSFKK